MTRDEAELAGTLAFRAALRELADERLERLRAVARVAAASYRPPGLNCEMSRALDGLEPGDV